MLETKTLVGLLGRAGSGKSTAAKYMEQAYGAKRLSIARPLKEMCRDMFGFSQEQVWGDAKVKETVDPRWGVTPRDMMQRLSVAARNHLGDDVWIRGVIDSVYNTEGRLFVLEDVRFLNEVRLIRGLDCQSKAPLLSGVVLKLVCTTPFSTDSGNHPSEAEVDLVPTDLLRGVIESPITEESVHLKTEIDKAMIRLGLIFGG